MVQYNYVGLTNLSMALKTELAKAIPVKDISSGIDSHIFKSIKSGVRVKKFTDRKLYTTGLDTHGYNNISKSRGGMIDNVTHPFYATDHTIETTDLPPYIKERLKDMSKTPNLDWLLPLS
jgi:hypothetical protein